MHAMPNRFSLASTVGRGHLMLRSDVRNTKLRLAELGYVETLEPSTLEVPDDAFFQAIREYQTDHGLTVDGVMRPGGETEHSIQKVSNEEEWNRKRGGKSPTLWCANPNCGAPHGGSKGMLCPDCYKKKEGGDSTIKVTPRRGGGYRRGGGGPGGPTLLDLF